VANPDLELEVRSCGKVLNIFQLHLPLQKVIYHYPEYNNNNNNNNNNKLKMALEIKNI